MPEISKLVTAGECRAGVLCLCNSLTTQALGYSTLRNGSFHRHKVMSIFKVVPHVMAYCSCSSIDTSQYNQLPPNFAR